MRQHLFPTGGILPFAGAVATEGYLLCDGSSYDITKYADLYKVILFTYGGSVATFKVPDLRGRLPMGAGTGTGLNASGTGAPTGSAQTARTRGAWGGEETHLLTGAESGTSVHGHTAFQNTHSHQYERGEWVTAGAAGGAVGVWAATKYSMQWATYTQPGVTVNPSTNADATNRHAVTPPFVVLNYLIKY